MLVADISDAVWLAVIGLATMALKEYFDQTRERSKTAKLNGIARTTDETNEKIEVVHDIVNGSSAAMRTEIVDLKETIIGLRKEIGKEP